MEKGFGPDDDMVLHGSCSNAIWHPAYYQEQYSQ